MKGNVAINGFGRIGRTVCRIIMGNPDLNLVAINASYDAATLAHLLRYDSVHGRFPGEVIAVDDALLINSRRVQLIAERDAGKLPWADLGVEIVIDATGKHTNHDKASLHLKSGAQKVIITTASKDPDITVVMGVNQSAYDHKTHHVLAAASCTTNCLAPMVKILHDHYGIISGLMTTVHSYTNDQNILDNPHRDLRRARGGALSIIPTTTGAARAVAQVLPELKGRLNGFALRVPSPNVSVVDLVARVGKPVTAATVNAALKTAADGPMQGILKYCDEPLVSSDWVGDSHSCIIDSLCTMVGPDHMVKVIAWYDNEWGYSTRVLDLATHVVRAAREAAWVAAD